MVPVSARGLARASAFIFAFAFFWGFVTILGLGLGGGRGSVGVGVNAHPEPEPDSIEPLSASDLLRRREHEHLAQKRHLAARSCARSINAFHSSRRVKRGVLGQVPLVLADADGKNDKDENDKDGEGKVKGNVEGEEDRLKASTCVVTPELMEGPYYVNDELVRTELVEDQEGVVLTLDIGVVDVATCEPVPNAFVEIWSANATGVYGAFETKNVGEPPPPGRGPGDRPPPGDRNPPDTPDPDRPDRPGRPPGGGPSMSTNNTWLRGGYPTSSPSGTVSLTTLYPGFYPGRTTHIHLMVHTSWSQHPSNSTLISHSGKVRHVGQMFFEEGWNDEVLAREPYVWNEARRTRNEEDGLFRKAVGDRSSAIVELEMLGKSLDEGLLGFITIAIDLTVEYSIHSGNYYNSSTNTDPSSNVVDIDV